MHRLCLVTLLCACGRYGFDARVQADGSPPIARYRKPIAITPGATLTDFRVGVFVAADAELAAGARADARDLAFTAADGTTALPFEVESYGAGTLVAWVRVPTLGPSTQIYLYYGGPALDLQDPAATWASDLAVWHLGDSGPAKDSTSHGHVLQTPPTSAVPTTVPGIAGFARMFDASTLLVVTDPPDGSLDMGSGSFSISLWVLKTTSANQFDMPLYKGGASGPNPGYDIEIGSQAWRIDISDGSTGKLAIFSPTPLYGTWKHLVGVCDRGVNQLSAYVDGALQNQIDISSIGSIDSPLDLEVGHSTYPIAGIVDEIRIYDHALTPEWIAAEHANLATPAAFVSVGPEEPAP